MMCGHRCVYSLDIGSNFNVAHPVWFYSQNLIENNKHTAPSYSSVTLICVYFPFTFFVSVHKPQHYGCFFFLPSVKHLHGDHQYRSSKEPFDNKKHTDLRFEWDCPNSVLQSKLYFCKWWLFAAVERGWVTQGPGLLLFWFWAAVGIRGTRETLNIHRATSVSLHCTEMFTPITHICHRVHSRLLTEHTHAHIYFHIKRDY